MHDQSDLVELLSQLEESKFLRLFRHLVELPDLFLPGDQLAKPPIPLDLPDAELQLKLGGAVGSMHSWAHAWLFQIAHLPSFLWEPQFIESFINKRLRQAFENLAKAPHPLAAFRGVFDETSHFSPKPEGYDYYLFTNMCLDLDERALSKFADSAHSLFSEVLGTPRAEHPSFGIGTPESIVGNYRAEAHRFIVDLIKMPSSYYYIAREGQISVIPSTEHGTFLAHPPGTDSKLSPEGLSAVVTSNLLGTGLPAVPGLSELQLLINSKNTTEQDLQRFFEKNPHFLFGLDERYCEIRPHVCLFDSKRERLIPDFLARIEDSHIWNVIELKMPQHPLTVRSNGSERPSAFAARAVAELLQYRDFFSVRDNRERVTDRLGTAPYEPCLVLVIGRGRSTERYEWHSTRLGFPKVQIVSYDYLFERARRCRAMLSELSSRAEPRP
jgi:antiviral defense system Shedu protein SduA